MYCSNVQARCHGDTNMAITNVPNHKAGALAKQAAATHLLQLRRVLCQPRESLAPSGSRNIRPKVNAEGAAEQQSISASQQEETRRRPREPSAHSESLNVRPKDSMTSLRVQSPTSVPQTTQSMHPQVMVKEGTSHIKASRALLSSQVNTQVCGQADVVHGYNSHLEPQPTAFLRLPQEASRRPQLRSIAFNCVPRVSGLKGSLEEVGALQALPFLAPPPHGWRA